MSDNCFASCNTKTARKLCPSLFRTPDDGCLTAVCASFISKRFSFHISKVSVFTGGQKEPVCERKKHMVEGGRLDEGSELDSHPRLVSDQ